MKTAIAAALSLMAGGAVAQTTSTNCQRIGDQVYCTSTTDRGVDWGLANQPPAQPTYNPFADIQQNTERLERQRADQHAEENRRYVMRQVSDMIEDHECAEAVRFALKAGAMDLAQLVPTVCTPK